MGGVESGRVFESEDGKTVRMAVEGSWLGGEGEKREKEGGMGGGRVGKKEELERGMRTDDYGIGMTLLECITLSEHPNTEQAVRQALRVNYYP